MNMTEKLYGLVSFDEPIHATKAALGSLVKVTIGGVSGVLEFPSAPDWSAAPEGSRLDCPLVAPQSVSTLKEGDQSVYWGSPTKYPQGWARVHKALLMFELPSETLREQATNVHRGFTQWHKLFNQYLELVTRQRKSAGVEIADNPSQLQIFRQRGDGKIDHPYDPGPISIVINSSDEETLLLKPDQLVEICGLASSLIEPSIHYQIQLEAYRALRNLDYRKAIIETGTAAELALGRAALDLMVSQGIAFADKILSKYQALTGRLELARTVGVVLPQVNYVEELVTVRNRIVHRGQFAERQSAFNAVRVTDDLLHAIVSGWHDSP